ncbi:MAG: diphthine--ammonia ligase [archaeon]
MKLGILFSGGKDSTFAAYLAKEYGNDIACLITISSKNPFSHMFHTPSITSTKKQAEAMGILWIDVETEGEKETELEDLKKAILKAKEEYDIDGVVTGAVESVYQATRIQKICNELDLEVFNPLWQKDQTELLKNLLENKFEIIITGVAAYGLDKSWLGRKIDKKFIEDIKKLHDKYQLNQAGEGGEFETLVLNCPLFSKKLEITEQKILTDGDNHRMEVTIK